LFLYHSCLMVNPFIGRSAPRAPSFQARSLSLWHFHYALALANAKISIFFLKRFERDSH